MKSSKHKVLSVSGIVDVISIGLTAATAFGFLGRLFWFFDLFAHFRVQYMQLCLPLIAIALWKRLSRRAVALVLLAAINYAFVLPLYFGRPPAAEGKPVRAMLMNIHAVNGNTGLVLHTIREADPDILVLLEVTPKWSAELEGLNDEYPHRLAKVREDPFGIMLLSRYPWENAEVVYIGETDVPSITADIHLPEGKLFLIATHPVPPLSAADSRQRNSQLMELPYVAAGRKKVLLMGDLNVTPFSYWFKRVTEMELENSMKGFGFQPTWPTAIPFMKIPIDHVLHSPEIVIHNRAVGGPVGSDHLPVIVDFSLE